MDVRKRPNLIQSDLRLATSLWLALRAHFVRPNSLQLRFILKVKSISRSCGNVKKLHPATFLECKVTPG
jgi:hypothetical protein